MHIAKYEEFREIKKGMKVAYMFRNELKLTRTIADSYYNFDSDEKDGKLRQQTVFYALEMFTFQRNICM